MELSNGRKFHALKSSQAAYAAYLASSTWRSIRSRRLEYDGNRCADCGHDGTEFRLEVHHLTYDRFGGSERLEDLQTLCNPCHMILHGRSAIALPVAGPTNSDLAERAKLETEQLETLLIFSGDQSAIKRRRRRLDKEVDSLGKRLKEAVHFDDQDEKHAVLVEMLAHIEKVLSFFEVALLPREGEIPPSRSSSLDRSGRQNASQRVVFTGKPWKQALNDENARPGRNQIGR